MAYYRFYPPTINLPENLNYRVKIPVSTRKTPKYPKTLKENMSSMMIRGTYPKCVLDKIERNDPLLDVAKILEEAALKDPYLIDNRLYPNVDFYSGIVLSALEIPINMFAVMFAIGRLPGWISQWKEGREDTVTRLHRPRQVYVGPKERNYVPLNERG